MASESLEGPKLSTVYDDIEELDVMEMDAALLRDLLEELETEAMGADDNAADGCKAEPLELPPEIDDQKSLADGCGHDCLKQYEAHIHEFDNWFGMMETAPPLPSEGVIDWYVDASMDEMVGMIDFGDSFQFFNGVFFDETPYSCLWQHD